MRDSQEGEKTRENREKLEEKFIPEPPLENGGTSEENMNELYVPEHFAHGYLVLEPSVVSYNCGEKFYGEYDDGIMYNDPDLGVEWPFDEIGGIENLIIADKDKNLQTFKEYEDKYLK